MKNSLYPMYSQKYLLDQQDILASLSNGLNPLFRSRINFDPRCIVEVPIPEKKIGDPYFILRQHLDPSLHAKMYPQLVK